MFPCPFAIPHKYFNHKLLNARKFLEQIPYIGVFFFLSEAASRPDYIAWALLGMLIVA